MTRYPDVTLAILAGGRATRMGGVPKGLLEVGGRPVLARLLDLRPRFAGALLLTADPSPYRAFGLEAVPDRIQDRGAPGGLHAALHAAKTDWVFLVACDMPFVTAQAADVLLGARAEGDTWLMFERDGRPCPLPGAFHKALLPQVEARLPEAPSLRGLVEGAPGRRVGEAALRTVDPALRCLVGLNTPEDVQREGGRIPSLIWEKRGC